MNFKKFKRKFSDDSSEISDQTNPKKKHQKIQALSSDRSIIGNMFDASMKFLGTLRNYLSLETLKIEFLNKFLKIFQVS